MSAMPHPTRRTFIARTALASTALATIPRQLRAAEASARQKAAVIGHTGRGDYGHGLDKIFAGRDGIELVAVVDPDAAGRQKALTRTGVPRAYADHREMLATEKPRLVCVAMRCADQHHAIIRDCLQAGAHVYSEKPFVTAPVESDELLKIAQSKGLKVAVAHTMRMMPIVMRLRQGIREGLIGDLVELRAYGKQDQRAGGEDMMVLGSHLFDFMRAFAGDPLSCSGRVLQDGRGIKREDRRMIKDGVGYVAGNEVFAHFAFASGVNATFTSSAKLRETVGHWGVELFGSKGVARINCDIAPNVFLRRSSAWATQGKTDEWKPLDEALVKTPPDHNLGPVGDWLDAIRHDREPECSARNGAWAVEMVSAVYTSALSSGAVTFPLKNRAHPLG